MKTKTNLKKKMLIAPAILLFALFFNLSVGINNDGSIKLFPSALACHKTYTLSGYEWTDIRASEEACNGYCESEGYNKGIVTGIGSKVCAGATCSYVSDFSTGVQSEVGNDGHCGCNSQFTCACSNIEVEKPDLIIKDVYLKPENPTTNDTICLYAIIKNIGTENIELHDLTSWTYVNDIHAANTFYGKNISIEETITKEIFCSKYGDNVWFVKGENTIKVNIDPGSVNIIPESNEENNEKVLSFEITESVAEAVCGNNICEENESPYSCKTDCTGWEEVLDTQKCTTWHAPNVFNYSPCGDTKIYEIRTGDELRFVAYGDSCASCVCYSLNFDIYDYVGDTWTKVKSVNNGSVKNSSNVFNYIPKGEKVKVIGTSGCFHFNLYKKYDEAEENENDWDVSIKFDKAHKATFYPFSGNAGEIEKTYYAKLSESDNLYEEYVGGECCEYWSNSYYYNKFEEEQARRAKGWYVERKKISDNKYKLLIRGIAWADCSYEGYGYVKGELNLNPEGNWKISEVVKCNARGSNKGQETYCETDDKFVKFAAGNTCGGCCACADSGSLDIEVIIEKVAVNNVEINNNSGDCLPDGTLIKLPNDSRIFVINDCQKQWIRTAEEFKNSGYEWSDIKETSSDVVNAYADYLETTAKLLRAVGHNRVFRVVDGKRLWVPTISAFNAQGLKWDNIGEASDKELEKYPKIKLIKEKGNDKIFYITNSGMKKYIINAKVFSSYNNKYSDVVEVDSEIVSSFDTVDLFKDEDGSKVYKIEGNKKMWVKSEKVFNKHNFDWNKVVPANKVELDAYADAEALE